MASYGAGQYGTGTYANLSAGAGSQTLNGVLFQKAATFPAGAVTPGAKTITGVLFQRAATFPAGAVTPGAVTVAGVLYQNTPTFPGGAVTVGATTIIGALFTKAPTFPAGTVTPGTVTLTGVLHQHTATFNPGAANLTGFDLEGYRFRFDDGTETTATWAFFPDQPITAGTPRRLRVLINTTGDEPSTGFSLQFRRVGDPDSEWETVTT